MVVEITQVIDMDGRQFSDDLINKMLPFATYRDQFLKEHLYDPATILELDEQQETEPVFSSEEKEQSSKYNNSWSNIRQLIAALSFPEFHFQFYFFQNGRQH
jgi:hypothetical protein